MSLAKTYASSELEHREERSRPAQPLFAAAPEPPRSFQTPIAALRPMPPSRARPTRFPAIRTVLKAGSIITLLTVGTAGSCGLVAGGWHGIAFATLFFSAMGVLGMVVGLLVAVAVDGSRVVREGFSAPPVVRTEILERGAGQLAMSLPSDGTLGHAEAPAPGSGKSEEKRE